MIKALSKTQMDPIDEVIRTKSCKEIHKPYAQNIDTCDAQVTYAKSQEYLESIEHVIEKPRGKQNINTWLEIRNAEAFDA